MMAALRSGGQFGVALDALNAHAITVREAVELQKLKKALQAKVEGR
jgi:hypothetical protein